MIVDFSNFVHVATVEFKKKVIHVERQIRSYRPTKSNDCCWSTVVRECGNVPTITNNIQVDNPASDGYDDDNDDFGRGIAKVCFAQFFQGNSPPRAYLSPSWRDRRSKGRVGAAVGGGSRA